ncbi:MAG: ECF transporter S component [Oscillospiraceae bacterium]|nr:ECF transporter S component [Oscillospiraceae bacterium]
MIKDEKTKRLTRLAMLSAVSVVLVALIHIPIFPTASYLKYDPADIPILITTFLYGPGYGVAVTVVVSVIQGLTVSADGGVIGILMHILATGAFCLVAGFIYKAKHTIRGAVIALIAGSLTMAAVMAGCNLLLTPLYTGLSVDAVAAMILPIILPFNLIKAGINSVITFFIYKPISKLFGHEAQ